MSEEHVVIVDSLHKEFRLPHQKIESIKGVFTGAFSFSQNTYETQVALHDINFKIKKGEFYGIVGRNGSGKSTLLKLIAGIYQPTKGKISVDGRIVPFIELGVGFNGELTGRENVYLNGALMGFSKQEIRKKYDDIVEFAELEKFMDQKLKNYSSGMQVRLAFSVATRLAESDILLIDEVLAVGDADFQRKCFYYFKQLKQQKKTVVFVTHDMNAVREYCDKALLIDKSKIVKIGTPESIAQSYTKMFMKDADGTGKNTNDKRWGNRQATLQGVEISPKKLTNKSENIGITARVKANIDTQDLVVGFAVKSSDGKPIFGTNTKTERRSTGSWKKGAVKTIEWSVPNILADGKFSVDVAVLLEDGLSVCDWVEDAAQILSYEDKMNPYSVSPEIKTKIQEAK